MDESTLVEVMKWLSNYQKKNAAVYKWSGLGEDTKGWSKAICDSHGHVIGHETREFRGHHT